MASKKITQLPATLGFNLTDLLAKVNDPSGTPLTEKGTITQLLTFIGGLLVISNTDFVGGTTYTNTTNFPCFVSAMWQSSQSTSMDGAGGLYVDQDGGGVFETPMLVLPYSFGGSDGAFPFSMIIKPGGKWKFDNVDSNDTGMVVTGTSQLITVNV